MYYHADVVMDSRRIFIFILVLTFGASFLTHQFADGRELRREFACADEAIHLDCGNRSIIAVHEAYVTSDVTDNVTCQIENLDEDEDGRETTNGSSCYEDIRISVNRMCSGNKFCSYAYSNDSEIQKQTGCERGLVVVRYDCVREASLTRYCNTKLHQKEGYFASPGYPKYYMKLKDCEWDIEAAEGQTIVLKVLHLQMRPASVVIGPSSPAMLDPDLIYALGHLPAYSDPVTRCDLDVLTVLEGHVERLRACGESLKALEQTIEAEGEKGLAIRFKAVDFMPSSGFLAFYKIQGCPSIAASEGSYLRERNGSAAIFACYNQNVFNDTAESTRFLQCVRDHHWNDTLPPCVPVKVVEDTTTITTIIPFKSIQEAEENITIGNTEPAASSVQLGPSYLEDILIPSVLIGVLLVGNSVILLIIIIIRRRQKSKSKEEDEEFEEQKTKNPIVNDTAHSTV